MTELLQKDASNDQEILSNLNFLKGNVTSICVSLIENRGKIINENKSKILDFFGYCNEDEENVIKVE